MDKIIHGDSAAELKKLPDNSIDTLVTDPPYGYSFMGKDWDKALPDINIWKECNRVLKPGAFAFVMSAPRSDVCARMMLDLEDAGFRIDFTPIYWTYASGFPKAMNIGKMVDKRGGVLLGKEFCALIKKKRQELGLSKTQLAALGGFHGAVNHGGSVSNWEEGQGCPTVEQYNKLVEVLGLDGDPLAEAQREVIGKNPNGFGHNTGSSLTHNLEAHPDLTAPATPQAKALDGSYGGFQPKPAVEVIIVAMKPLSEKTFVDQALKNGKGITWLDDCRVPGTWERSTTTRDDIRGGNFVKGEVKQVECEPQAAHVNGRFPANLLVSDDVLSDHSRFFSLDEWADTLPFLAVPKASKGEKNEGLEDREIETVGDGRKKAIDNAFQRGKTERKNIHPTVKPLKLMAYLVTLGSRPGDVVLDPFLGSGTTAIAAKQLGRSYIGIEKEKEYVEIAEARLNTVHPTLL